MKNIARGRYTIEGRLGEGDLTTVYKAQDQERGTAVALKVLRPEVDARPGARPAFLELSRAATRLDYPYVVPTLDVGTDDDETPYVAVELMEGGSMAHRIKRTGPLDLATALVLCKATLGALAVGHHAGIVHGDVRPTNLLVARGGKPKLGDFGLDRLRWIDDGEATTAARNWGYLPPERRKNPTRASASSDVYSVGALLYALTTGQVPPDLFASGLDRAMLDSMPERLRALVSRACRYHAEERFESAKAMLQAVTELEQALKAPAAARSRDLGTDEETEVATDAHRAPARTAIPPSETEDDETMTDGRAPSSWTPRPSAPAASTSPAGAAVDDEDMPTMTGAQIDSAVQSTRPLGPSAPALGPRASGPAPAPRAAPRVEVLPDEPAVVAIAVDPPPARSTRGAPASEPRGPLLLGLAVIGGLVAVCAVYLWRMGGDEPVAEPATAAVEPPTPVAQDPEPDAAAESTVDPATPPDEGLAAPAPEPTAPPPAPVASLPETPPKAAPAPAKATAPTQAAAPKKPDATKTASTSSGGDDGMDDPSISRRATEPAVDGGGVVYGVVIEGSSTTSSSGSGQVLEAPATEGSSTWEATAEPPAAATAPPADPPAAEPSPAPAAEPSPAPAAEAPGEDATPAPVPLAAEPPPAEPPPAEPAAAPPAEAEAPAPADG